MGTYPDDHEGSDRGISGAPVAVVCGLFHLSESGSPKKTLQDDDHTHGGCDSAVYMQSVFSGLLQHKAGSCAGIYTVLLRAPHPGEPCVLISAGRSDQAWGKTGSGCAQKANDLNDLVLCDRPVYGVCIAALAYDDFARHYSVDPVCVPYG